ncbi:MAG: AAA family ATPase [Paracoccaceae bacterium]|nr:AAA family ATPase [Paracoccaceae bacterium]
MTQLDIARLPGADPAAVPPVSNADGPAAPDLLLLLGRQRWPLLLGALFGLIAGGLHDATSPDRYYAAATVLIDERATDPGEEFTADFPLLRNETAALNEMQVLRSLELAKDVTRRLSLHEDQAFLHPPVSLARTALGNAASTLSGLVAAPEQPAEGAGPSEDERIVAAAAKLQREVGITRVGRSFSIEISMILHEPQLAAEIANAYATAYLADRQVASRAMSSAGADWLRRNIDDVRRSADAAAREAAAFRAENRALDPQGMQALEQRVVTLNEIHAKLLERLEMITIEGSYPISNGRLLSEAVTPQTAALPKAWRLLAGGLVLGLFGGLMFAVWRELRETGVRTGAEVRALTGLPFLGYLPRFRKRRLRRLRPVVMQPLLLEGIPPVEFARVRPQAPEVVTTVSPTDPCRHFSPTLYLPSVAPDLPYNEPLKGLLARLLRQPRPGEGCVAAIGSVNSGEGRTTLAANLAQFAALSGHRTLLIDADVSNPSLSAELGFAGEVGLYDVLAGRAVLGDCVTVLPATGLDVLPYTVPAAHRGQTGIMKIGSPLAEARRRYDLVVLDTQPLGHSSDIAAMLNALDAVVMVADWGRTARSALQASVANDPELARKTLGVVLNRTIMGRLGAYGVQRDQVRRHPRRLRA